MKTTHLLSLLATFGAVSLGLFVTSLFLGQFALTAFATCVTLLLALSAVRDYAPRHRAFEPARFTRQQARLPLAA